MRKDMNLCKIVCELCEEYIATNSDVALEGMIRTLAIMVNGEEVVQWFNEEENTWEFTNLTEMDIELPVVKLNYEFSEEEIKEASKDFKDGIRLGGDATYKEIRITKYCTKEEQKTTLIHELVHAAQYRIPGYEMDNESSYYERTHEIEAYAIAALATEHMDNKDSIRIGRSTRRNTRSRR